MKYSGDEIMIMDADTFSDIFKNKNVIVELKNGNTVADSITEITLSSCEDGQSHCHLPTYIKMRGKDINLYDIKTIEKL